MITPNLDAPVILVPVDFDEASREAVALAGEYARALNGAVVILHVIPPTTFPDGTRILPVEATDPVDLAEYVSARARRLLGEYFVSVIMKGVEVRKEARSGATVETILEAIEQSGAKLVVMGTHGRRGVSRALLGSVAENVLRRSPVPVMIVHAGGVSVESAA